MCFSASANFAGSAVTVAYFLQALPLTRAAVTHI